MTVNVTGIIFCHAMYVFLYFQTFENIKHMQVEKYHRANEEERKNIECNPVTIFKEALENCKPILTLTKVVKGGVAYQVWSV